ncbi:MAG TPA: DoxX family protein [Blastocatellia bacterium]|nr:DoxX family protein [Blastocatellia bacterium]
MNETAIFSLSASISTLAVLALVIWNRSAPASRKIARAFYILSLLLSFAALTNTLLSVSGLLPLKGPFLSIHRALIYRLSLVIGAGLGSAVLMLANTFGHFKWRGTNEAVRSFISSPYLLKGICLSVSISYFAIEIGKAKYDAEMRQFFLGSGYPIWFMYFIMVAEVGGAIGLLMAKTVIPAASGLIIIMLGAIYTHYHNSDPFSDSLEAVHHLALLVCIIIIALRRGRLSSSCL